MEHEFNNIINENKINKINDHIYLTNKQIEVLNNHQINYQDCHDLKELLFLMDDIDDEEIDIYMVNPKAPCFIKDDEGKFIYLILPVNFNNVSN